METATQPDARPGLLSRLCGELKRLAVVVVLGAAVFVAGKYYCVDRLNEEVRLHVENLLRSHYQGLGVSVASARRVPGSGIELRDIVIRDGDAADSPILVRIEEVFAACDTRLPDFITKSPQITSLEVRRLKLRAERQPDGYWNLSRLLPLPGMGGGPAPPATIRDGSLEIIDPTHSEATPLALRNIELTVEPSVEPASGVRERPEGAAPAKRESHREAYTSRSPGNAPHSPRMLRVRGSLAGDHLERVEIDGVLDPHSAAWDIRGAIEGMEFNPRLRTALPREISSLLAPLSTVRGRTYLGFHVKKGPGVLGGESHSAKENALPPKTPDPLAPAPEIIFVVSGRIAEGRIDDARLPEPLTDVEATIRADNRGVVIQDLAARCGSTQLELDAEIFGYKAGSPMRLDVVARQLEVQRVPVQSLPPALQKVYADFSPLGRVDLTAHLEFDGHTWQPQATIQCHDLSISYHRFPYRLVGGTGSIELKHDHLSARLKLLTGSQSVQCRAEVDRPGPAFSGWVEIQSEGAVNVDEKLMGALEPQFQRIVRAFRPRGAASFQGRLARNPGERDFHRKLFITLHDCSIQHEKFSYPIDKVNGSLELTGRDWLFRNLTGRNDSAYIVGEGAWVADAADGNPLRLQFTATDVPLADELRDALVPGAYRLWANLRPRGNIDHLTVGLRYNAAERRMAVDVQGEKWPPGQNIEGRTLSIEPSWFRYRMDNLTGRIHYRDGLIELTGLSASHGRASIEAGGHVQVRGDGSCRLELTRLSADRLEADSDLLLALPPTVAQGLSRLAVNGPMNVLGTLAVTVPGQPEESPQIDWDVQCDVENGRLATITPVEHIHGGLRLIGESGPRGAFSRGELTVDSAVVRGVQLTQIRGPLLLDGQRIVFGSAAERDLAGRVPRSVTANVFLGQLSAEGELLLTPAGDFGLRVGLENADLAAVVSELAPRQKGLSGKVFGLANLAGTLEGIHTWRGSGQVRLRDADVYELPVMIAMLNLLSLKRPDRTAFNTADLDFHIEGDDLAFERINFNGDPLCLKGTGRLTGQRELDLKFHPQFGRDEQHLPIFRPLVSETSRQFMLVEVTGTLDKLRVDRRMLPSLDERLAEMFPEQAARQAAREQQAPLINLPKLWWR